MFFNGIGFGNRSKEQIIWDAEDRVDAARRELAAAETALKEARSITSAAEAYAEFDNKQTRA